MVETRGGRRFAIFFLAAAFTLLLAGRWLTPINHALLTVAAPFISVVNGVTTGVGDTLGSITDGPQLARENAQLKRQLAELLQANAVLQQDKHENSLLRSLVKFDSANPQMHFISARVIYNDESGVSPIIIIDRGSRSGIRPGMTVVENHGYFVGSVSDVTSNAARVQLMTSPSSSVGAVDLQTQAGGLVEGQYAARPQFRWAVASSTLHRGDFVVTSGQLNLYPRNILLGQIIKVYHSNVTLFQTAEIQPMADFQHLEDVQVVNFPPSKPARLLTPH